MPALAVSTIRTPSWPARLELGFERRAAGTRLIHRRHRGPLLVQRPFFPEADGTCHLYVLHPPGGVAGGDELELDVTVGPSASALLTTPAATKVYRTRAAASVLRQSHAVSAGGSLEWLPQETIVFGGARLEGVTRVELGEDARYAGWEIVCLGRPASRDDFEAGSVELRTELWQDGRPLVVDHCRVEAGSHARCGAWGWGGKSVYATLLATGATEAMLRELRSSIAVNGAAELFSVTALGSVLACRFLGSSAAAAKAALGAAWSVVRRLSFGKPASPPRIWAT